MPRDAQTAVSRSRQDTYTYGIGAMRARMRDHLQPREFSVDAARVHYLPVMGVSMTLH